MKFTNVTSFVKFNSPRRYTLQDNDGSLTNTSKCGWVVPNWPHLRVKPHCTPRSNYDGIVCDCNVMIRKVYFYGKNPGGKISIRILRLEGNEAYNTSKMRSFSNIFFQV